MQGKARAGRCDAKNSAYCCTHYLLKKGDVVLSVCEYTVVANMQNSCDQILIYFYD